MEPIILPKQKVSIWQILFYFSMGVVLLWLILKLSGVIQTPLWLEVGVPTAGLLLGIFTLYRNIFNGIKDLSVGLATVAVKVDHIEKDVSSLKQDMFVVKQDTSLLKKDMSIVKKKLRLS